MVSISFDEYFLYIAIVWRLVISRPDHDRLLVSLRGKEMMINILFACSTMTSSSMLPILYIVSSSSFYMMLSSNSLSMIYVIP